MLVLASLLFPLATKLVVGTILGLAFTWEAVWPVMKIAARQTVLLAERSKPGFASFASDFDAHFRARPDVYLNLLLMRLLMCCASTPPGTPPSSSGTTAGLSTDVQSPPSF